MMETFSILKKYSRHPRPETDSFGVGPTAALWSRRRTTSGALPWVLVLFLIFPSSLVGLAQAVEPVDSIWLGADGKPLPFRTDQDVLEFLQTAEIVSKKRISEGINRPWRVELERDGIRVKACFRDVHIFHRELDLPDGKHFNFRDDAVFELAAFELGRLLGMRNIPPVVERTFMGKKGTLQLWVENAFSETQRLADGLRPKDLKLWRCQHELMVLFDNLIYNEDRNQGNILFDRQWNRWLIDHTRAFRNHRRLLTPENVKRCNWKVWERLRQLDRQTLDERLGPYLTGTQVQAILDRRDLLQTLLQARIDRYGRSKVLSRGPINIQKPDPIR